MTTAKTPCYCGYGCEAGVDRNGDASSRGDHADGQYSRVDNDTYQVDHAEAILFWNAEADCTWGVTFVDRAEYDRWDKMTIREQEAYLGFTWLHPDERKAKRLPPVELDAKGKPKAEDPAKRKARLEAGTFLKSYAGTDTFLLDVRDRITPPRRGRLSDKQVEAVLKAKARIEAAIKDADPRASEAVDWCYSNAPHNTFAGSLMEAYERWGSLTARQVAAVLKSIDRDGPSRPEATERPPAVEGIYKVGDDVFKVQKSQAGRLYAKRLIATDGKGTWEYAPGQVNRLSADDLMPLEDAMKFGQLYGWCIVCSRKLTDEKSIAKGIGPVCEKKGHLA